MTHTLSIQEILYPQAGKEGFGKEEYGVGWNK